MQNVNIRESARFSMNEVKSTTVFKVEDCSSIISGSFDVLYARNDLTKMAEHENSSGPAIIYRVNEWRCILSDQRSPHRRNGERLVAAVCNLRVADRAV